VPVIATEQRLRAHVERLAGEIGARGVFRPAALAAAADYVEGEWRAQGFRVERETYDVAGLACSNLVVEIAGARRAEEILLVGAHYDTVETTPGADDNASAVAVLLEMARACAGLRPASTLRLVAFVNEEPPFFPIGKTGSWIHARAARRRGERIRLMVSLEMLGYYRSEPGSQRYPPVFRYFYPARGDFLAFVSNLRSRRELRRLVSAFRASSDFPVASAATFAWVPGVAWSDHLSFWRAGYRAVMATDTAFYRNPHYHGPGDTPDQLDYKAMARVTAGLSGAVRELTGAEAASGVDSAVTAPR
jgi:Zn-dependent M28 family amino/carboxypeptidase